MRVIGLMSGTSADGIEGVLCELEGAPPRLEARVVGSHSTPFAPELQRRVHAAAQAGSSDVETISRLHAELGDRFADAAVQVARSAGIDLAAVDLIGSHGQTVWHAVDPDGSVRATLQLGQAAVIAERTGVTVVSDFRQRDIAAGGQGAPLVSYLDWLLLRANGHWRAIQNIGGIGNVTLLPPLETADGVPVAFDTGPGNVLIDCLVGLISDGARTYDEDGALAASGIVGEAWLEHLLADEPYYHRPPPKTTGRELFGPAMAHALLVDGRARGLGEADIVATATALTARSIADAYDRFAPVPPAEIVVAGGGARNPTLMAMLAREVARTLGPGSDPPRIMAHDELGIEAHHKEALAFAVLAHETWHGRPGSLPALTGARHPVVLGTITPGARYLELARATYGARGS